MSNGLTASNILSVLPDVLAQDEEMNALAVSIASVLADRSSEIENLSIYSRIEQLPEELLDILAYDFKCDWWDYDYSLSEKRETLKKCWYIHKHKGTPSAVETALSAIYPDSKVEEWFEYSGQPYHFRIIIPIDQSSLDPAKHARVMELINYYKNLRSVLDSVEYNGTTTSITVYTATSPVAVHITNKAVADQQASGADYLLDELNAILIDEVNSELIDSD